MILSPDADGFNLRQGIWLEAGRQDLTVKVSNLIENHATIEQKADGYDLTDYLINQQKEVNELNETHGSYNTKLEIVLNDESLKRDFETFLTNRKRLLCITTDYPKMKPKEYTTELQNLRQIILVYKKE